MGRIKKTSRALQKAHKRLSGLKAIDVKLDMGNGMTVENFESRITDTETRLSEYNELLAQSDAAKNVFSKCEAELTDLYKRLLEAVAVVYGHDSDEYEKAGGTRKSDRKRPVRKPKVS
jgi:uncharacterized coiled-coil protein SlyX